MDQTNTVRSSELDDLRTTLDYIEGRWRDADRHILRAGFAELARGQAVSPCTLGALARTSEAEARHSMKSGPVGLDSDGNMVELFGVMLDEARHRVEVEGRTIYACCALVAHTIPILLDTSVILESADPLTREAIRLEINIDGVISSSEGVFACFPTPPTASDLSTVSQAFCSHIQYLASEETAAAFADLDSRRRIVDASTLHGLAKETVRRIWS